MFFDMNVILGERVPFAASPVKAITPAEFLQRVGS